MKLAQLKNSIIVLLFLPLLALAAVPVDNFDSYATGNLDGLNGGTSWSEAWGDTTGICSTWYDVVSTPVQGGTRAAHTATSGGECGRGFTADSTENQAYGLYLRAASTASGLVSVWQTGATGIARIVLTTGGQIAVINNLTADNLQAYSADTWYKVDIRITSFAGKTFQARVDDGSWTADKTFYNNNAATSLSLFWSSGQSTVDSYFDTIGPPAAAAADDIQYESGSFFQLLWNFLFNNVYAHE